MLDLIVYIHPVLQGESCKSVPEVVELNMFDACRCQGLLMDVSEGSGSIHDADLKGGEKVDANQNIKQGRTADVTVLPWQ